MHQKSILIVDDDVAALLIARRMIESMGYSCDVAQNGREAVAAATTHDYSFILMDIWMPLMNGCDAAREILSGRISGYGPCIVGMISVEDIETIQRCSNVGMASVINKPLCRKHLRDMFGFSGKSKSML